MINNNHSCRTCGEPFEEWIDLARHQIERSKVKTDLHKKDNYGTRWAKDYNKKYIRMKLGTIGKKEQYRPPLTDEQRQSKVDSRRELSGVPKRVNIYCPKCKIITPQLLPVEYVESPQAVRNPQGVLEVICNVCRRNT